MEQELRPIIINLNLRALNFAFNQDIKGNTDTKRCTTIPLADNFATEGGYTVKTGANAGKEMRTSDLQLICWPVSDESKEQYGKKNDYDVRLSISPKALEELKATNPQLAARLDSRGDGYDRDLAKQVLPYIGRAFVMKSNGVSPEHLTATAPTMSDGDDDLPF